MEESVDLVGPYMVISSGFPSWKCLLGQSHFAQREYSVLDRLIWSIWEKRVLCSRDSLLLVVRVESTVIAVIGENMDVPQEYLNYEMKCFDTFIEDKKQNTTFVLCRC